MTITGVILLSLLFIILICGIYIMGQAETIKQQNKQVEQMKEALEKIAHGDTWTAYPHDIAKWALEELK